MSEVEEYEVENVVEAKLQTASGKGKGGKGKQKQKMGWQYSVKWKGYGPEENTWEPADSFESSGDVLARFWERVNTDGRDISNLDLFKPNETFRPSGPPRRAKRQKPKDMGELTNNGNNASQPEDEPTPKAKSDKRLGSPTDAEDEEPPTKRKRGRPSAQAAESSASAAKPKRNHNGENVYVSKSASARTRTRPSSKRQKSGHGRAPSEGDIVLDSPSADSHGEIHPPHSVMDISAQSDTPALTFNESDTEDLALDSPKEPSLPSHRVRTTKPLVKLADDGMDFDNGISTKTRLVKQPSTSEASSSTPARRTPKNRASVLTVTKSGLKSVKGNYKQPDKQPDRNDSKDASPHRQTGVVGDDTMEVDAALAMDSSPVNVPTGQELLETAGFDQADVEGLPDFEEDVPPTVTAPIKEPIVRNPNVAKAASSLFPDQPSSSGFSFGMGSFTRPSIFDRFMREPSASMGSMVPALPAFSLSLDSSVIVPIYLRDIYPEVGASSLSNVVAAHPKGPPGKFYREEIASSLVEYLGPGGSSARVEVNENVDETHKEHFERFRSRLEGGELFVCLSGEHVLAFWSSSNADVGKKLGAPESLVGLAAIVVVSLVNIVDLSGYADVACNAEHFLCAVLNENRYSPTIPDGTGFPAWAYLDVTVQDQFSPTDADNTYNSGASESTPPGLGTPSSTSVVVTSTATSKTGSTFSNSPTSTGSSAASSESPGKKANIAAIAGGTVGGLVLVSALAGLVACWLVRRRKSDDIREPLEGSGQRENTYVETPPNAYWPPVSYERDSFYGDSNASDSYIATPDSRGASSAAATTRHSVISGPPPEHSSASSDSWDASPSSPTVVQYSPAPSNFGLYSGVPQAI
ncbi:hypothetical protein FIBSPDRAFT_955424 [Athelia psychrophila]|uniref:Chromo domain-containing protein n=1 Tax=Athelia psychrophila TaxID=1759441 RepID=A0A166I841_9AGAM|nr:hypothetical protein FIBSPDRAFT_955424 [Fibularhizoctonia sp. CBS 109695]